MSDQESKKISDGFEDEMDQFFKDRSLQMQQIKAEETPCHSERSEESIKEGENFKPGSGCCMTGCPDCPWGYRVPGPL